MNISGPLNLQPLISQLPPNKEIPTGLDFLIISLQSPTWITHCSYYKKSGLMVNCTKPGYTLNLSGHFMGRYTKSHHSSKENRKRSEKPPQEIFLLFPGRLVRLFQVITVIIIFLSSLRANLGIRQRSIRMAPMGTRGRYKEFRRGSPRRCPGGQRSRRCWGTGVASRRTWGW